MDEIYSIENKNMNMIPFKNQYTLAKNVYFILYSIIDYHFSNRRFIYRIRSVENRYKVESSAYNFYYNNQPYSKQNQLAWPTTAQETEIDIETERVFFPILRRGIRMKIECFETVYKRSIKTIINLFISIQRVWF